MDKGINVLLNAYKLLLDDLDNVILMIVGAIDSLSGIDSNLWEWAQGSKQIIFTSEVINTQEYFASFDLFVLPSYREGFGTVVLEASAMNVPVIVSNILGPTEAILDNVTGVTFKSGNEYDLYLKMKMFFVDKCILSEYDSDGYLFVKKRFDSNLVIENNIRWIISKVDMLKK